MGTTPTPGHFVSPSARTGHCGHHTPKPSVDSAVPRQAFRLTAISIGGDLTAGNATTALATTPADLIHAVWQELLRSPPYEFDIDPVEDNDDPRKLSTLRSRR